MSVEQRLRAPGFGTPNETTLIPVSLAAGSYSIEVTSRDSHHREGYQPDQLQEQFVIELFDTGGSLVFISAPISDLAEAATTLTEIVNSDVNLPEIGSFKARHIGTASSVDSIDVVCVRFIPT